MEDVQESPAMDEGGQRITGDKQLKTWLRQAAQLPQSQRTKSIADTKGLYIRLHVSGSQDWLFRYTYGKPRVMLFGHYPEMSLPAARVEAAKARVLLDQGSDPADARRERVNHQLAKLKARENTVAFLANEWLDADIRGVIASEKKVEATVQNYIIARVGARPANEFRSDELKKLLRWVREHAGPTVSNEVLRYVRRIYDQAARERAPGIDFNPTVGLRLKDAGGTEEPRERALADKELVELFKAIAKSESFGRQNEISVHLILRIANRKMELLGAKWVEFDLDSGEWGQKIAESTGKRVRTPRRKRRPVIPLPPTAIRLLKEQKVLSCGSEYVFPARRISKRRRFPHVSPDTLNLALKNLAGKREPFTVHDLRRTSRTLLAKFGVIDDVAELSLGHAIKGTKGVYNVYKYFDERRAALLLLEQHYNNLMAAAGVELFA